jgi:hypothetical protein
MRNAWKTSGTGIALSVMSCLSLYGQATKANISHVISSMSGTWVADQTQPKMGSEPRLRFRAAASGGLEELRGPEKSPLIQPVKFDGKSYAMEGGNSLVWKQVDANNFVRTTAMNGKQLSTRHIRISSDGKTLSEETERTSLAGEKQTRTAEYRRTSADKKGLEGNWEATSVRLSVPLELKFEPAGPSALKQTDRMGISNTLFFDGKTSPITGAGAIAGRIVSATVIDGNTIETTTTREGREAGKSRIALSSEGKVMTVTTTSVREDKSGEPSVTVFRKR